MLICPVCRSQNMETAKFCGNCGHPFPRPSEPTSSLINCPQGHIYSAVYQHCPYCPQPAAQDVSFATRVEEAVTAIELPVVPEKSPAPDDFITRLGDEEVMLAEAYSEEAKPREASVPPPGYSPTEVITTTPHLESLLKQEMEEEHPPASVTPSPSMPTLEETLPPAPPPVESVPEKPPASFKPQPVGIGEPDRRTIIVSDQHTPPRGSKGKIVGWLISYSLNPDGEDFRIYAGYNRMGANPVCDIVIDDETVSGSHAIIVYRDGRCLIKDDLSRNGTFVNGREITEAHPLQNYDQVRVGNTHLTFVSAQRI